MTNRILILDELTANQIAAGEVVERPASVVKELVENSIDAGSTVIQVELEDAGLKKIRVTDNGIGMSVEDAQLAFSRHATSKIRTIDDLLNVQTLGFRGEALPSIAAVSRLELITRIPESDTATQIIVSNGNIIQKKELSRNIGTQVTVNDLFYNTPARRKFLKSNATELGHIVDQLERFMLGHPGISFLVKHQGRVILQSLGNNNLLEVISGVYGRETAKSMITVKFEQENYSIEGVVSQPNLTRSTRRWQAIYLNGRHISSRLVSEAITEAYQTRLTGGRYPLAILNLRVPSNQVDVNVHPTKLEVRFQDEQLVHQLVVSGVSQALQAAQTPVNFWITGIADLNSSNMEEKPIFKPNITQKETDDQLPVQPLNLFEHQECPLNKTRPDIVINNNQYPETTEQYLDYQVEEKAWQIEESSSSVLTSVIQEKDNLVSDQPSKFSELSPLGQFKETYIIAVGPMGLYIIDQHAAHERVRYEQIKDIALKTAVTSQSLLFPLTLELAGEDREVLVKSIMQLRDIGFILEHFGGNTFLLREVPVYIDGDERSFFFDILELLRDSQWRVKGVQLLDETIKLAACKSAIKAGAVLNKAEMEQLLIQLDQVIQPYTCPHGRPTIFRLSPEELEKRFLRV